MKNMILFVKSSKTGIFSISINFFHFYRRSNEIREMMNFKIKLPTGTTTHKYIKVNRFLGRFISSTHKFSESIHSCWTLLDIGHSKNKKTKKWNEKEISNNFVLFPIHSLTTQCEQKTLFSLHICSYICFTWI